MLYTAVRCWEVMLNEEISGPASFKRLVGRLVGQ